MLNKKYLSTNQKLVPGIYGGLGPMAHIKFEEELITECNKKGIKKDQDYPVWLVASAASTPDRTVSIGGGPTSLNHLKYFSKILEKHGADFIVITCNTAHYYKEVIEKDIEIPILSLINETANFIARSHPLVEKVGLIATNGTVNTKLYQNALSVYGIKTIVPDARAQKSVMESIYNQEFGIKSTGIDLSKKAISIVKETSDKLITAGAEIIIAGCTEISLAFAAPELEAFPYIDPMKILASSVIDKCFSIFNINGHKKPLIRKRNVFSYQFETLERNEK